MVVVKRLLVRTVPVAAVQALPSRALSSRRVVRVRLPRSAVHEGTKQVLCLHMLGIS